MSTRLYGRRLESLDAKLSGHDRAVISLLLELRFATTNQLERWLFDGITPQARARAARRSIAKLAGLGVIRHLHRRIGGVRAGSAGNINVLTPVGLRLAAIYGWIAPEQVRRVREPGGQFVRHYLAVTDAHLRLVEAEQQGRIELLRREAEPACWRSFTTAAGAHVLKPDAFAVIGTPEHELTWFIEVDRGTTSTATIQRQLDAYVAYWRSGLEIAARDVHPRTLWLTPPGRRQEQLENAIHRLPAEAHPLFGVAPFEQAIEAMTGAGQ